jgi:hypothetical protein
MIHGISLSEKALRYPERISVDEVTAEAFAILRHRRPAALMAREAREMSAAITVK